MKYMILVYASQRDYDADLDGPGLAALAADGDLPMPQVEVAAPRVVAVAADAREFRQAHPFSRGPLAAA